jgi:predicted kinase
MSLFRILQGIPGSGKSTHARKFADACNDQGQRAYICSADDYYQTPTGWRYVPGVAHLAHGQCFKSAIRAIHSGYNVVIIDNTNTSVAEVAPYVALGQAYGYEVEILRFNCSLETSIERNIHAVPPDICQAMHSTLSNFDVLAPKFWPKVLQVGG